jgi:hypothetical protein
MPWTILLGTRGFSEMAWLGQEPFFWKLNLELFKVQVQLHFSKKTKLVKGDLLNASNSHENG